MDKHKKVLSGDSELLIIKLDKVVAETQKAALLLCEGDQDWFPHSMIRIIDKGKNTQRVEVPKWLLKQKGWV